MESDNIQKSMEQDERIERFIRNQMTQEEETAFLDGISSEPELKERAFATALMARGMKRRRKEEQQVFVAMLNGSIAQNANKAKATAFRRYAAVAASLLLLLGVGGYVGFAEYGYQQRNAIVSANISLEQTGLDRGEGDNMQSRLDSIAAVVKNERDITEAIAVLQGLYDKRQADIDCAQNSATISWYLTMAYIKDNQKGKAVNLLVALKKEHPEMTSKINKILELLQ